MYMYIRREDGSDIVGDEDIAYDDGTMLHAKGVVSL